MYEKLTSDFANSVSLSLNPFKRHEEVKDLLADPSMVRDIRVVHDMEHLFVHSSETVIALSTISPFLGRGALKKVARTIEVLNNMEN